MRYLRSILAVLTGLAFLVLLLVLALYVYITPERFHQQFSQSISNRFGILLETAALPKIQHLPKLVVHYPQTTFTSVNSELKGAIKNFSISMSPFAVFALNPRIERITVQGLSVATQKDQASQFWNQIQQSSVTFPLEHLEFKDAQLHVMDGETSLVKLNYIALSLNHFNEQTTSYATEFLMKRQDFTGQGKVQGIVDWTQGLNQTKWLNTQAELTGLQNGKSTKITTIVNQIAKEEQQVVFSDLQLTIQTPQTTEIRFHTPSLSWNGQTIASSECHANYAYATPNGSQTFVATSPVSVTLNPLAIYAPSIAITASAISSSDGVESRNGNIEGSLFLDSPMNQGEIKLSGHIFNAPTNIQLQIANVTSLPLFNASQQEASQKKALVTGTLQLDRFDISKTLPQWSSKIVQTVDAEVAFSISPTAPFEKLQHVTGNLTIQNNQAKIHHGQWVLPSGNAPYTATLLDDQWQVNSEWKNIDINDFAPKLLAGQSSGTLKATGDFTKPDLTRIESTIHVGQGVLYGINLPQIAEIMRTEQPATTPLEAVSQQSSCAFYNLETRIAATKNQFNIESAALAGDGWQAALSGSSHQISGAVQFANADNKALFTLPLKVTLKDPKWQLDWETAIQSAIATQGELPWSLQRFKNKLSRELEDWWNNFDPMTIELPNVELPNIELPEIELPNVELPDWLAPYLDSKPDNTPQNQPV